MTARITKSLAKKLGMLAGSALIAATALTGPAKAEQNFLLSTASTGGTYYPVGVALATLVKVKLLPKHKINMSAINSAGSGENVKLLRENEAQFAILQGLYGSYAWNGTGPLANDGPQKELRSVTMLWQNVEHFIVEKEYAKTGTVDDLKAMNGLKMALGKKNSGTLGSNKTILSNLGIDLDASYELVHLGYGPSGDALQNGTVAGISTPAGVPVGAVTKTFAAMKDDAVLLNFTDEQMKTANGGLDLWTRYVIPAGTYPNQANDVNTIAQPNFLAVRADADEEAVYMITKTIYENLPFLQSIHKATKAMSLDAATNGLPMPLHPGAARYYKEAGLDLPANLIAN
ncbi:TAXI family TRAP transporter solute-binding subunit [Aestuariispira insulae]|uniref:TRAP transporter TAXI family solute receptor n=1 Tax=Aestuariispira insulae TaxID=1461337 RepID=A0A3D9HS21_9PROT|nr:TAXI family TRAP transporter solute-binding subunit [Aestuariispira insulae]RED52313.1 hypothetical protein DFP90_102333 [Aestuariispira insulae]